MGFLLECWPGVPITSFAKWVLLVPCGRPKSASLCCLQKRPGEGGHGRQEVELYPEWNKLESWAQCFGGPWAVLQVTPEAVSKGEG